MDDVITFKKILECWKKKEFSKDFENQLEEYLLEKEKSFGDVRIKDIPRWLSQVMIVIEIGEKINPERFIKHRKFWESLLLREWEVDLDEVIVKWKKKTNL